MIKYEAWGLDTFAHEYYLCGTYTSRDAAEKERDKNQKLARETQGEALGDKFWQEVNWENEMDCFTQIHFETYYRDNKTLAVGIGVAVRSGYYYGGSIFRTCSFSGTLREILQWADTEKALDDCVNTFKDLIRGFRVD